MKEFLNKKTNIDIPADERNPEGESKKATYADLIIQALKAFRPEGFTLDDMRKRWKLIDKFEPLCKKPAGKIKIEDKEAGDLQEIMKDFKWLAMDRELLEMTDAILKMKSVRA